MGSIIGSDTSLVVRPFVLHLIAMSNAVRAGTQQCRRLRKASKEMSDITYEPCTPMAWD
jgi:hypothetical protein